MVLKGWIALSLATVCICVGSAVNAKSVFDDYLATLENDLSRLDIKEMHDSLQRQDPESSETGNGCLCKGTVCVCCQMVDIPELKLHANCCALVHYDTSSRYFQIVVGVGKYDVFAIETTNGDLPLLGGVVSSSLNALVGIEFDPLKNDTSGFSSCVYLYIADSSGIPLGCFTLKYSVDNVFRFHGDELVAEAILLRKQFRIRMKSSVVEKDDGAYE